MSKVESSVEVIMKEFEEYPKHLEEDVWLLSSIMSGSLPSLEIFNPKWTEAKRRRFIRKVWNSRDSYRRDVLNQPFDGVTWPLESSHGYGEDYTITLLDYTTGLGRCQPQIYEGYGNAKKMWVGAKVCLAIHRQVFEGCVGEVISESHGKWLVSFPTEDGTLHGRFATHELFNLGEFHEKVQDSQDLDEGSSRR